MTASAYIYADGGDISEEINQYQYIKEFDTEAVMGRAWLGFGEMRRMRHANFVVDAYVNRGRSQSWEAWAKDNPGAAKVLFDGAKLAREMFNYG